MPLPPSILTPLSGTTAYATPADLIARYDKRDIAQWASDTGLPITETKLPNDLNVLAALADASGDIEAACLMSDRYLPQDLGALQGNSQNLLKRLTCELAIGYLYERRLRRGEESEPAAYKRGLETLERLRKGEWVFGFVEHGDAGVVSHQVEAAGDVEARNMTTFLSARYFGRRSNRFDFSGNAATVTPQQGGTCLIGGP
jgi:phage gp36-like protein